MSRAPMIDMSQIWPMTGTVIGRNLRWLRDYTGKSWRAAALEAGMSESGVKHAVRGTSKSPRHENLEAVAKAYWITAADLASPSLPYDFERICRPDAPREAWAANRAKRLRPKPPRKARPIVAVKDADKADKLFKDQLLFINQAWSVLSFDHRNAALDFITKLVSLQREQT